MSRGEFLTRFSMWVTLAGYFIGVATPLFSRKSPLMELCARWAWTIACLSLVIHVGCAYHFYHGWSQAAAYRETARQTADVTGLNWGGGLYFNYALIAVWIVDVVWWWWGGKIYCRLPRIINVIWHAFLLFMIFNATVIFATGAVRLIGLILCMTVCLLWVYHRAYASTTAG